MRLAEVEKTAEAANAARAEEIAAIEEFTKSEVGMSQYTPLVLAILGDPEKHKTKWTLPDIGKQYLQEHLYDIRGLVGWLDERPNGATVQEVMDKLSWTKEHIAELEDLRALQADNRCFQRQHHDLDT